MSDRELFSSRTPILNIPTQYLWLWLWLWLSYGRKSAIFGLFWSPKSLGWHIVTETTNKTFDIFIINLFHMNLICKSLIII